MNISKRQPGGYIQRAIVRVVRNFSDSNLGTGQHLNLWQRYRSEQALFLMRKRSMT